MKNRTLLFSILGLLAMGYSCKSSAYTHHMVRMVDAKSFMDHPMSASLYYYK